MIDHENSETLVCVKLLLVCFSDQEIAAEGSLWQDPVFEITGNTGSVAMVHGVLQSVQPELLLVRMHSTGFELQMVELQQLFSKSNIPIICMSESFRNTELLALHYAGFGCLVKPCTAQDLHDLAGFTLKKHRELSSALLRESRLYSFFNHAPVAYQSLDENGIILDVNINWEQLLGYTRAEVIGTSLRQYLTGEYQLQIREIFAEFKRKGRTQNSKLEFTHKSGAKVTVVVDGHIINHPNGSLSHTQCILYDITKEQSSQLAISHNEERYKALIQSALDGFLLVDTDANILDANNAYCATTGHSVEWLKTKKVFDVDYVDSPEGTKKRIEKIIASGFDRFETKHICADGSYIDYEVNIVYQAEIKQFLCFCNNITARKKLEQVQMHLLQGSFSLPGEDYFQSLASYIAKQLGFDYVCIDILKGDLLSAQTIAIYYNGKFDDNVEYTLKETPCGDVVGNTVCVFPKGVRYLFPNDTVLQEIEAEGYIGVTLWSRIGTPIGLIAAISKLPFKEQGFYETVMQQIAMRAAGELERRMAEEELRQSEEQHRRLIEEMQEGLLQVDNQDIILFVNAQFCQMLGYTRDELLGKRGVDFLIAPEDRDLILQKNKDRLLGVKEQYHLEMIKKSGERILLFMNATPVTNNNGMVTGSLATCLDITENRETENQLRLSEERYRSITENAFDIVALLNLEGIFLYCNNSFYKILGYNEEEIVGAYCVHFIVPENRGYIETMLVESARAVIPSSDIVIQMICKNGGYKLVDAKARMLYDNYGNPDKILLIAHDVTDEIQSKKIITARNAILEFSTNHTLFEVLQKTLDEAELLTGSNIGFYHFLLADQKTLSLQAWSTNTIKTMCKAEGKGLHYHVEDAGVWAECVKTKEPVIHNDYFSLPNKKGMPEGHAVVLRELVVPVLRDNNIVAILGVGNKKDLFNADDIRMVAQLADLAWEIAENKQAVDALENSEARYKVISRLSTDFAYSCVHNGNFYEVNWISDAFYTMTGFTEKELADHKCWLFTAHDEDRGNILKKLSSLESSEMTVDEFRLIDKNGGTHYIINYMECVPDAGAKLGKRIIGAVKDITKRKETEEALLESEEIFTQFLKHSPVHVFIKDSQGKAVRLSSNFEQMLGLPLDQILGKDMEEIFEGEFGKKMKADDIKVLKAGMKLVLEESFNGREYTTIKYPIVHKGQPLYLAGFTIDVTEQRNSEKKLRENEERLRLVIENSPVGIGLSRDGINLDANRVFLKMFGYDEVGLIKGTSVLNQVAVQCRAVVRERVEKHSLGLLVEDNYETIGLRTDGSEFPLLISVNRIELSEGPLTISFFIDLTEQKLKADALRESEEKYRGLVQESPDAIAIYSEGKIVFVNNASVRLMRAASEGDMLGKSVLDFVHPDSREFVKNRMAKVMVEGKALPAAEELFVRFDGSLVNVEVVAIPVIFEKKQGVQIIVRDITERKEAAEEIAILSRAVEQGPASIIITDLDATIEYVNSKVVLTSGFSSYELVGNKPDFMQPGRMPTEEINSLWETLHSGNEWRCEFQNQTKTGDLYWEFVSVSPIKDVLGTYSHYLIIKENITERKALEKSLIDAKLKAEAANSLKDAFIANISHEIRTPLNGILGMTSIIESVFAEQSGPDEKLLFTSIGVSTHRLMSTIDMILKFSRLQVGEYPSKPSHFPLSMLLNKVVNEYRPIAREKAIDMVTTFSVHEDIVFADENSVMSAISNIIDNAIKFSNDGEIALTLYRNAASELSIEVRDNGIGISSDYLAHLFEPYTQEQTGFGRGYEGVGLGLSIAKRLLDLDHAYITVTSKKHVGSIFTVSFKKVVESKGAESAAYKEQPDSLQVSQRIDSTNKRPMILVVEDDGINQLYMRSILKSKYDVFLAPDADSALEIFRGKNFDLILTDISLKKGMHGLDLTKLIRSGDHNQNVPIIAVTGHAFPEDRIKAIDAGCDEYLAKPFTEQELLQKITPIIGNE